VAGFGSTIETADHRLHQLELVRRQNRVDRVVVLLADRVYLRLKVLEGEGRRRRVEDRLNPGVVRLRQQPHLLLLLRGKAQVPGEATDLLRDRVAAPAKSQRLYPTLRDIALR
jgi:hypothetical protein